jgi:hypothetical protein
LGELIRVHLHEVSDQGGLLPGTNSDEADHGGMRMIQSDGEVAKILVESYENPGFIECTTEDFLVAGVMLPLTSPDDIESSRAQLCERTTPNAAIEQ